MSYKYENEIKNAIHLFWQTKTNQHAHSTDKSNRGAVTGGKQLDGFIVILKKLALSAGVKEIVFLQRTTIFRAISVHLKTGILLFSRHPVSSLSPLN